MSCDLSGAIEYREADLVDAPGIAQVNRDTLAE
jgi:hypothetical protein